MEENSLGQIHLDDLAVDRFSAAMKAKMDSARQKGRGGWESEQCDTQRLQTMLLDHLEKGDPVDVGNFAMMLWNRGEATASVASKCKEKLGQFAYEAFMAEQKSSKLAAEWGLAQITIAELRKEINAIKAGGVVVPLGITPEMRKAWDNAPQGEDDDVNMNNAYAAMIKAAPSFLHTPDIDAVANVLWNDALEEAALICDGVNNHDNPMTAADCADAIRDLKFKVESPSNEYQWTEADDEHS